MSLNAGQRGQLTALLAQADDADLDAVGVVLIRRGRRAAAVGDEAARAARRTERARHVLAMATIDQATGLDQARADRDAALAAVYGTQAFQDAQAAAALAIRIGNDAMRSTARAMMAALVAPARDAYAAAVAAAAVAPAFTAELATRAANVAQVEADLRAAREARRAN